MAAFLPASPDQAAFRDELLAQGMLLASDVPGLYGHGAVFDDVLCAVDQWLGRVGAVEHPEQLRFPPLIPRRDLEMNGYLSSFPHLAGTVFSFEGGQAEALEQAERAGRHEDWSRCQAMTELTLTPAACYAAYPAMGARGSLPPGGATLDLGPAWVFRHEPSGDPARMQTFHMREMVRFGEPETVSAWRDRWRDRSVALLRSIGLDARADIASDPFFGRAGRMLAASQRDQELKFELLVPIAGPQPTAVASFNYHHDHFAAPYAIRTAAGAIAHTACIGFGLERITLALIRTHGPHPARWPEAVGHVLWPR